MNNQLAWCYLCEDQLAELKNNRAPVCRRCQSEEKRLVRGLRAVESSKLHRCVPHLGEGIGWYMLTQ